MGNLQKMEDYGPNVNGFVEKCSAGILSQYEPDCRRQVACLNEFLAKQNQLLSTIDSELGKFSALDNLQLDDMMSIIRTCKHRLQNIKERMRKASIKTSKLKARSLKIQQIKQKEALDRELKREAQLTREQEMVSKSPSFTNYCPENTSKALPPKPPSVHSL
ncbi:uncharacterized protein LOC128998217 [Macrosteles quadrilineatus]|uniref:uncharacterized protein LOC128998217 n=1 Tax=Macrosteles quadrilineatus TaxID=74068 RepID=UPI0023E2401C|nr:uncharacterized protein LOC128998217 [Macrosteles quadrilineatus]